MPTFQIELPDGSKKFEIDAPNIAAAYEAVGQFGKAPPEEEGSTLGGSLKAAGVGLGEGLIGLAGLPGDVAELGTQGINYLTGSNLQNKVPLPTSAGIQSAIERNITGPFYQPKGTIERGLQTAGSFAPALLGGPESLITKLATRVALPAVGTELAGAAAEGTGAEPVARLGGAVAGTVLGHKLTAPKALPLDTALKDVRESADIKYNALRPTEFSPGYAEQVSNQVQKGLARDFNDANADKTFKTLEKLKTPAGPQIADEAIGEILNPEAKMGAKGSIPAAEAISKEIPAHTFADFQNARTQLSRIAGNFNDPVEQAAASTAIKLLDKQLANAPQSAFRNANAPAFKKALEEARADYSVAKTGERVKEKAIDNAQLKAAAANSGRNIGNVTRQQERSILTSQKGRRGLTEEEQNILENNVRGSFIQNSARQMGHVLGGGGGLGQLLAAGGGYLATGSPFGLAAPIAGHALQAAANKMATKGAEKVVRKILERSPHYQEYLRALPPDKRNLAKSLAAVGLLGYRPQGLLAQ